MSHRKCCQPNTTVAQCWCSTNDFTCCTWHHCRKSDTTIDRMSLWTAT